MALQVTIHRNSLLRTKWLTFSEHLFFVIMGRKAKMLVFLGHWLPKTLDILA